MAASWDRIAKSVAVDPLPWWSALQVVIPSLTPVEVETVGSLVALVLECAPQAESEARLLAERSPMILASLYYAYCESGGSFQLSERKALERLPQSAAVAAFARKNASRHADLGADSWTVGVIRDISAVDPEYAWRVLRAIIEATSENDLGRVGAGDLEHFCKIASTAFIERIEADAAEDAKLRTALRSVWPGGETIPEPIYRRIRAASGLPSR